MRCPSLAIGLVAAVALALAPVPAAAQPGAAGASLSEAALALERGDYAIAAARALPIAEGPDTVSVADRAEAWRIVGIARFFQGDRAGAEDAFLATLRLDPEAHLDPALVPPEVIVAFEDVRGRHAAELDALRPRPGKRRSMWINFLPSGGQFQNGEPTKGWIVAGSTALFLAANVTTYAILQSWCDDTAVCGADGERGDAARAVRTANLVTGAALIGVYAYSVIDGILGYRRLERAEAEESAGARLGVVPVSGGAAEVGLGLGISGRF